MQGKNNGGRRWPILVGSVLALAFHALPVLAQTSCKPGQPSGVFVCDGTTLPVVKPMMLTVKDCAVKIDKAQCDPSQPQPYRWLTDARREAGLDQAAASELARFSFKHQENDFAVSGGAVGVVTSLGWGGMTLESLDTHYALTLNGVYPGVKQRDCLLAQKSIDGYEIKPSACKTRAERDKEAAAASVASKPAAPAGKTVDQLYSEQEGSCKKQLVRGLCQLELKKKLCRERQPGDNSAICSSL